MNGTAYPLEYNPATNTWTVLARMPSLRIDFAVAAYQTKIYVIGGQDPYRLDLISGLNEVYDTVRNTWSTQAPMPKNENSIHANVVNGKIYVMGGAQSTTWGVSDPIQVYNPSADSWSTAAPMPIPFYAYASTVVDNRIYIMGGMPITNGIQQPVNATQIYDTETDKWTFGVPLPTPIAYAAAGATNGIMAPKRIYVLGGADGTSLNQVYNPATDSWTTGAPMLLGRFSFGVAVVNDKLYAMGGYMFKPNPFSEDFGIYNPFSNSIEQYTPVGYGSSDRTAPEIAVLSPENKTYTSANVSVTFTVNKPARWLGYSLDGQGEITITGNTTLAGLPDGDHNLTVYAEDDAGNIGASETIHFSITTEPVTQQETEFSTILIAATGASLAAIGAALIVYYKKPRKKQIDHME